MTDKVLLPESEYLTIAEACRVSAHQGVFTQPVQAAALIQLAHLNLAMANAAVRHNAGRPS